MSEYKIRNAHCVYFEGQTGLCKAKEFVKCNPVNCKLYTIDELSTIVDLQEQLKRKTQECERLKSELSETIGAIDNVRKAKEYYQQECEELKKGNEKLKAQIENEKQALQIYIDNLNQACLDLNQENDDLLNKLQAKEQEVKRIKKENQYHINTYCHFKNEIKKYKKAVYKYKAIVQDKIEHLYLSRREFLKEINSIPVRIACKGESFKNALNNFNNAISVINNEDNYKYTLDEIENFLKTIMETNRVYPLQANLQKVLNIINEAKEQ